MTESWLLTDAERERFAAYLERDADANEKMAAQIETLPGTSMEALAKRYRAEATAARIIAAKLKATETMR